MSPPILRPWGHERRLAAVALFGLPLAACLGTAGGQTFDLAAAAAGPEGAAGGPLRFTTPRGYEVELTAARLHVGAVYLDEELPVSNAQADDCLPPGRTTAEVRAPLDVDLLDGRPQPFPTAGTATSTTARAAEVWLTGSGDVYADDDPTPILALTGTARGASGSFPFAARVTVGKNRRRPPPSPAQPGANPLCKERIVAPIPVSVAPRPTGRLLVRVDPRRLFLTVDFAELRSTGATPPQYTFADDASDAPSVALFAALRAAALYSFEWQEP